jgi:hypothetical protein
MSNEQLARPRELRSAGLLASCRRLRMICLLPIVYCPLPIAY